MSVHTAQLGDFVRISGGGTPSRVRPEFFNGSIPWVTVKDLCGEFVLRGAQERITQAGLDSSASRLIPPGNVLLATRMAVGRAVINTVEVAINQDLKALICDSRLHPKYLLFFLTHKAPELEAKATGATVKGITIDEIESLNIPVPNLSEQKRIAELLDRADRLRGTRRYALELSDSFLPATFIKLFGDPSANPNGLPRDTIDAACEKIIDYRGRTPAYSEYGIAHVTAACIKEREIKWQDVKRVSEQTFTEYMTRGLPQFGDVLLTTEAPLGETAVVRSRERFSLAQRLILLRPSSRLMPDYLCHLLGHARFRSQLLRFATGSTVKGIIENYVTL